MSNHDKCLFVRLSSKMCTFHILKYMRIGKLVIEFVTAFMYFESRLNFKL